MVAILEVCFSGIGMACSLGIKSLSNSGYNGAFHIKHFFFLERPALYGVKGWRELWLFFVGDEAVVFSFGVFDGYSFPTLVICAFVFFFSDAFLDMVDFILAYDVIVI